LRKIIQIKTDTENRGFGKNRNRKPTDLKSRKNYRKPTPVSITNTDPALKCKFRKYIVGPIAVAYIL